MTPWAAIGPDAADRLRALVRPWSRAITEGGILPQASSTRAAFANGANQEPSSGG